MTGYVVEKGAEMTGHVAENRFGKRRDDESHALDYQKGMFFSEEDGGLERDWHELSMRDGGTRRGWIRPVFTA